MDAKAAPAEKKHRLRQLAGTDGEGLSIVDDPKPGAP
jgi:hypothetical protein